MAKIPFYMKIETTTNNNKNLLLNIKIKKWAMPFFVGKTFWQNVEIRPLILKPFLCLYFSIKAVL